HTADGLVGAGVPSASHTPRTAHSNEVEDAGSESRTSYEGATSGSPSRSCWNNRSAAASSHSTELPALVCAFMFATGTWRLSVDPPETPRMVSRICAMSIIEVLSPIAMPEAADWVNPHQRQGMRTVAGVAARSMIAPRH